MLRDWSHSWPSSNVSATLHLQQKCSESSSCTIIAFHRETESLRLNSIAMLIFQTFSFAHPIHDDIHRAPNHLALWTSFFIIKVVARSPNAFFLAFWAIEWRNMRWMIWVLDHGTSPSLFREQRFCCAGHQYASNAAGTINPIKNPRPDWHFIGSHYRKQKNEPHWRRNAK